MTASLDDILDRLGGPTLLARHWENGTAVPADAYLGLHRDRLLHGLDHTLVIYLDMNFRVRLCDAARGTGSAEAVRLLQTLRKIVRGREAIEPAAPGRDRHEFNAGSHAPAVPGGADIVESWRITTTVAVVRWT